MPPVGKSDHLLLEIQTLIKKITKRLVKKTFVDYKSIRADLSNVNWDNILEGHVNTNGTSSPKIPLLEEVQKEGGQSHLC